MARLYSARLIDQAAHQIGPQPGKLGEHAFEHPHPALAQGLEQKHRRNGIGCGDLAGQIRRMFIDDLAFGRFVPGRFPGVPAEQVLNGAFYLLIQARRIDLIFLDDMLAQRGGHSPVHWLGEMRAEIRSVEQGQLIGLADIGVIDQILQRIVGDRTRVVLISVWIAFTLPVSTSASETASETSFRM